MSLKILTKIKKYASLGHIFLLDIIFPKECLSCSKETEWLCQSCYKKISIKQTQVCPICAKNNFAGNLCKKCKEEYSLDGVLVASNYNDKLLAKTIKTYKYKLIKELATPLSQLLIDLITQILNESEKNYFWNNSDNKIIKDFKNNLIIPIPLHKKRENWRGFNQSEELAIIFSKYFNLEINSKNLKRIKFKRPQTKLDKEERFKNITNSFIWNGKNLHKKNIILVDDVSTSTATLNECAKVLKENNAGNIWGLVIAHG
jgi:ComF family protein